MEFDVGVQISGVESHRRMSGESQRTFQCQWKEKLCKEQKSAGPRTDPCGTRKEVGAGSDAWLWILTD